MKRRAVSTDGIPAAAGPYSAGMVQDRLLFLSGQGPFEPDGTLAGTDIETQTRQTLANLDAVARAAGTRLGNALRVGVFLADMDDFAGMNRVFADFFDKPYPARTTVRAGLPLAGMLVEIDAIVALDDPR